MQSWAFAVLGAVFGTAVLNASDFFIKMFATVTTSAEMPDKNSYWYT